jgi:hypothetical protein
VTDGAARRRFFEGGGSPVSLGDGGGVLQHEGEEREVRGMTTWPEGLRGHCSPEGGKRWCGSDKPGGGGDTPVGQGGHEVEGVWWGAARGLAEEEVSRG